MWGLGGNLRYLRILAILTPVRNFFSNTAIQKYIFILGTKRNTGKSIVHKVATPLVFTEKKTACKNIKGSAGYGSGGRG